MLKLQLVDTQPMNNLRAQLGRRFIRVLELRRMVSRFAFVGDRERDLVTTSAKAEHKRASHLSCAALAVTRA